MKQYSLLDTIHTPSDVRALQEDELPTLCREVRDFLIDSVSKTGGHLASNLGVVELTVALHYVFSLPDDKIVFDVGHQSYTHKLLTGRKEGFARLRKIGGISGFPRPAESPYDPFIAGHASNSISAALGIAEGALLQKSKDYTVAVIGDGALTGGEAYEALNNAGRSKTRLIIILNHNDMSISKNVGAFAKYLAVLRSKPGYLQMKHNVDTVLRHTPLVGKPLRDWLKRSKSLLKSMLYPSTFFEDMGFQYIGPVDGHDLKELTRVLSHAKELAAPVLVQVETVKGKGYREAEKNPRAYHAVSPPKSVSSVSSYSDEMGAALCTFANHDPRICAITAAMKYGTGLQAFAAAHRERFFDVGIAEEHAVTFAGGLASCGMLPVFCVYSSFLQRGYDQILHDLAIDQRHAVLCVDRAGLVGEDGETHQGVFDAAFLSQVPHITVYSPEGYDELRLCLHKALFDEAGLVAVRYPRGCDKKRHHLAISDDFSYKDRGGDTLLVSYGRLFSECAEAADGAKCPVSLLKLTKIAPISPAVLPLLMRYRHVVFAEEGIYTGGIGQQVGSLLMENGFTGKYRVLAIRDRFVGHGDVPSLLAGLGLNAAAIRDILNQEDAPNE